MGRRLTAIGLILILVSILLFSCNSVEPIQETKETNANSKSSIESEISSTVNTTTQDIDSSNTNINKIEKNLENNITGDNELKENNEYKEDWLTIDIVEDIGAYTGNSILINLKDINNKNLRMIETNDILNYFNEINDKELQNSLWEISMDGSMFILSNFYTDGEFILDLKNEKLIIDEKESQNFKTEFYNRFIKIDDTHYIFDEDYDWTIYNNGGYNDEDYVKFFNFDNKLVGGPLVSADNKKIVSIEKDNNSTYYFVFYDIEKDMIYNKVLIKEIDTDKISLSQWHNNDKILFNVGFKAYSYNIETREVTEIGKYLFNPILSYNENYLVYHKPRVTYNRYLMTDYKDYGETGIFVRDLSSNVDYKVEGDIFKKYEFYDLYPSRLIHTSIDYSKYLGH